MLLNSLPDVAVPSPSREDLEQYIVVAADPILLFAGASRVLLRQAEVGPRDCGSDASARYSNRSRTNCLASDALVPHTSTFPCAFSLQSHCLLHGFKYIMTYLHAIQSIYRVVMLKLFHLVYEPLLSEHASAAVFDSVLLRSNASC